MSKSGRRNNVDGSDAEFYPSDTASDYSNETAEHTNSEQKESSGKKINGKGRDSTLNSNDRITFSSSPVPKREGETPTTGSNDESDEERSLEDQFDHEAEHKTMEYEDFQKQYELRLQYQKEAIGEDWLKEEIELYEKLSMRGFQPLMPRHWGMDFRTIPESLFSPDDEECVIKSISGRDFRGELPFSSSSLRVY
jgi:hypothetical protein